MNHSFLRVAVFLLIYAFVAIQGKSQQKFTSPVTTISQYVPPGGYDTGIVVGAERVSEYMPLLKNKKVAVVANQSSLIKGTHLVDSLVKYGIQVKKVFTLEHGFRGTASAGEIITTEMDSKTGLPLVSLYGKEKKPSVASLKDVDVIVFDIQDVGARFYTYISSLHYIMQAAAENKKEVWILDRPNPNGFYVDGPVLNEKYKSFIGMHKVPVVHGMTIGEYAQMINGEKWLGKGLVCTLKIIACKGYTHRSLYKLPVPPSPNLRTMESVYAYPSMCLLEGTAVSVGRGTVFPFLFYGMPGFKNGDTTLTPVSTQSAKKPTFEGKLCKGYRLTEKEIDALIKSPGLNLEWLGKAYDNCPDKTKFVPEKGSFNLLCGNAWVRQLLLKGESTGEIHYDWRDELEQFKLIRKKYLLYEDFE
ncbi:MAG: exo-beta-N-acetylmuramidase NamZ domain-containing protein [Flavobacteriales bacterium]